MNGGFINQPLSFKDWIFEKLFVPVNFDGFHPLREKMDKSSVPTVWQEDTKACVPCAVSWISMFWNQGKFVNWKSLAEKCKTDAGGTMPSIVLKQAWDDGLIPNFYRLTDLSAKNIFSALHISPMVVGVESLPMVPEPHFMVLWDVTDDGNWFCLTWDKEGTQGWLELSMDYPIVFAATFYNPPIQHHPSQARLPILDVLKDKLKFYFC